MWCCPEAGQSGLDCFGQGLVAASSTWAASGMTYCIPPPPASVLSPVGKVGCRPAVHVSATPVVVDSNTSTGFFTRKRMNCLLPSVPPGDDLIIENTEVSGMGAFEELVDIEQIATLRDPLKEQLLELAKAHGEELAAN